MDTVEKLVFLHTLDPDHRSWWPTIDSIPATEVVGWGETLAASSEMDPKDWLKLCGILHWWRQHRDLSDAQRRWLVITVAVNLPLIERVEARWRSERSLTTGFM